jgi:hypothetical protein
VDLHCCKSTRGLLHSIRTCKAGQQNEGKHMCCVQCCQVCRLSMTSMRRLWVSGGRKYTELF